MDITKTEILKLSLEDFTEELASQSAKCKSRKDIEIFEKFLEDTSWEDSQNHGRREDYQRLIDSTLLQIDRLLGHNVMSSHVSIDEEEVIEVKVENNVIVGYKSLEKQDKE